MSALHVCSVTLFIWCFHMVFVKALCSLTVCVLHLLFYRPLNKLSLSLWPTCHWCETTTAVNCWMHWMHHHSRSLCVKSYFGSGRGDKIMPVIETCGEICWNAWWNTRKHGLSNWKLLNCEISVNHNVILIVAYWKPIPWCAFCGATCCPGRPANRNGADALCGSAFCREGSGTDRTVQAGCK